MLFKHAAVFTDIHFGQKNNSREYNADCEEFILWFIDQAKSRNCDVCIFTGDWHHSRANVNVSTLNYSVSNLRFLSEAFDMVYMLVGNHDLFYRSKREINSFPYAREFSNVVVVNDSIIEQDDVALVPWLVNDEWKKIKSLKSKYVFGHFELPRFMMNAIVRMPNQQELQVEHFKKAEYVFSGHFHKRQNEGNIHYIGSPFAHNYADVWDNDRGCMFLEWGKEPVYLNYESGPKYIKINLSQLLDKPEKYLNSKTYCKAMLDVPISYEEANFIKETFLKQFRPREFSLISSKRSEDIDSSQEAHIEIESVDQIMLSQLETIDSDLIDKNLLIDIYRNLI